MWLPESEYKVFQVLKNNTENGYCRLMDYQIAMMSYVKKGTVKKVLQNLEKKGLIQRYTKTVGSPMWDRPATAVSERKIKVFVA